MKSVPVQVFELGFVRLETVREVGATWGLSRVSTYVQSQLFDAERSKTVGLAPTLSAKDPSTILKTLAKMRYRAYALTFAQTPN